MIWTGPLAHVRNEALHRGIAVPQMSSGTSSGAAPSRSMGGPPMPSSVLDDLASLKRKIEASSGGDSSSWRDKLGHQDEYDARRANARHRRELIRDIHQRASIPTTGAWRSHEGPAYGERGASSHQRHGGRPTSQHAAEVPPPARTVARSIFSGFGHAHAAPHQ